MRKLIWLFILLSSGPGLAQESSAEMRSAMDLVAQARSEITEITVEELAGRPSPAVLIDVREPDEFAEGHIPGAVNIPRGKLEFAILNHPELQLIQEVDPGSLPRTEIVLYCRSGGRGALAAQSLQSMGFTQVLSVQGGYLEWVEKEGFIRQSPDN